MASTRDPHSILYRGPPPKRTNAKVQRYFAGVEPVFLPPADDEEEEKEEKQNASSVAEGAKIDESPQSSAAAPTPVKSSSESLAEIRSRRRLAALQQAPSTELAPLPDKLLTAIADAVADDFETISDKPAAAQLPVHELAPDESTTDAEGKLSVERGSLESSLEGENVRVADVKEQLKEQSSSSGEEEEDEEDSAAFSRPRFIPMKQRKAEELERLKKEEERRKSALESRREESRLLLKETVIKADVAEKERLELLENLNALEPKNMPPDDDDEDEEAAFAAWRDRELSRLRRAMQESEKRKEFEETLRKRRLMTESEKEADDKRLDALKPKEEAKSKYSYLQKYYHKGAFYQDLGTEGAESLYLRDFNAPTAEDAIDRSALPKVMQLRRGQFGHKGQTKHTHLTDVDTTDKTSAWSKIFKRRKVMKDERI